MHLEVQVALNFFISHLYNKLPRRRVNLFGEELERALKMKFANHWYPDKPMKGSAYRCLKTGRPTDPVLERAAQEANVSINDILENLPIDMSVWIDPGEVRSRQLHRICLD
jgi:protein Tob/BTG